MDTITYELPVITARKECIDGDQMARAVRSIDHEGVCGYEASAVIQHADYQFGARIGDSHMSRARPTLRAASVKNALGQKTST